METEALSRTAIIDQLDRNELALSGYEIIKAFLRLGNVDVDSEFSQVSFGGLPQLPAEPRTAVGAERRTGIAYDITLSPKDDGFQLVITQYTDNQVIGLQVRGLKSMVDRKAGLPNIEASSTTYTAQLADGQLKGLLKDVMAAGHSQRQP